MDRMGHVPLDRRSQHGTRKSAHARAGQNDPGEIQRIGIGDLREPGVIGTRRDGPRAADPMLRGARTVRR